MKSKIAYLILAAMAAACAAFAAIDVIEVRTGGTVSAPWPCKAVAARALSSVAGGTAAVKSVSSWETWGVATNVVAETNYTYTVVSTQLVDSAWATVTNTTSFDPSPWGAENWVSFATNAVVAISTNTAPVLASRSVATNSITASATCTNGVAIGAATATPWIAAGEPLFVDGTARGVVLLFVER